MNAKSSLSYKNREGTATGTGANPVFLPSFKNFKRLQKLDREISRLDNTIRWQKVEINVWEKEKDIKKLLKLKEKRNNLDQKRKIARYKKS